MTNTNVMRTPTKAAAMSPKNHCVLQMSRRKLSWRRMLAWTGSLTREGPGRAGPETKSEGPLVPDVPDIPSLMPFHALSCRAQVLSHSQPARHQKKLQGARTVQARERPNNQRI